MKICTFSLKSSDFPLCDLTPYSLLMWLFVIKIKSYNYYYTSQIFWKFLGLNTFIIHLIWTHIIDIVLP